MTMENIMRLLLILGVLVLQACQSQLIDKPQPATLKSVYQLSIEDAAVIQPEEVLPLPQITQDRARFVTWTSYPDSFKPGEELTLSWGDTWVTLDGAVQRQCQNYARDKGELNIRIQQLLGLPPEATAKRFFVVLDVKTENMFRPCANPELNSSSCTAQFPDTASESHKAWYAGQTALAYQFPGGYPWTRLGYTYDWNPAANDVGTFEFVVRKGATVKVVSVTPTLEYCK